MPIDRTALYRELHEEIGRTDDPVVKVRLDICLRSIALVGRIEERGPRIRDLVRSHRFDAGFQALHDEIMEVVGASEEVCPQMVAAIATRDLDSPEATATIARLGDIAGRMEALVPKLVAMLEELGIEFDPEKPAGARTLN